LLEGVIGLPPRVAVAVEPFLLADVISEALANDGVDQVVPITRLGHEHLDAAVVTVALPDDPDDNPDADVIIQLPDSLGNSGVGVVRTAEKAEPVLIASVDTILDLLDEYCPGRTRRTHR
jgi:hypothetical protein